MEQPSNWSRHDTFSEEAEVEEIGEPALNLIELDAAAEPRSFIKPSKSLHFSKSNSLYLLCFCTHFVIFFVLALCSVDEDELSSVYSHPSMMEGGNVRPYTLLLSSTPERNEILSHIVPEASGFTTDAYQVCVKCFFSFQ